MEAPEESLILKVKNEVNDPAKEKEKVKNLLLYYSYHSQNDHNNENHYHHNNDSNHIMKENEQTGNEHREAEEKDAEEEEEKKKKKKREIKGILEHDSDEPEEILSLKSMTLPEEDLYSLPTNNPSYDNDSKSPLGTAVQTGSLYISAISDRTKSTFVSRWLIENYEAAEGHSVLRSELYGHYLDYCQANGLGGVNAASFGKLLRGVFSEITTRRLGMRGQSKYHYCGIRPRDPQAFSSRSAAASAAAAVADYGDDFAMDEESLSENEVNESNMHAVPRGECMTKRRRASSPSILQGKAFRFRYNSPPYPLDAPELVDYTSMPMVNPSTIELADFPSIASFHIPIGLDPSHIQTLVVMYRAHCQRVYNSLTETRFFEIETLIRHFWSELPTHIYMLLEYPEILDYIAYCDHILYDACVTLLIPDVTQRLPIGLIQSLRQFSRQFEQYVLEGLKNSHNHQLRHCKLTSARQFGQKLRRYTSVNHLAQAASNVFDNPEQIQQMFYDFSRIDIESVRSQASWATECDIQDFIQLENDFKYLLQMVSKLPQFTKWLYNILNQCTQETRDYEEYQKTSRRFLLRWKFYCSLIMRELTLRSASSFGSFHLIHLLFDDYLFLLIDQRLEQLRDTTQSLPQPIQTSHSSLDSTDFGYSGTVPHSSCQMEPSYFPNTSSNVSFNHFSSTMTNLAEPLSSLKRPPISSGSNNHLSSLVIPKMQQCHSSNLSHNQQHSDYNRYHS
jgi:hypothetical protein